MRFIWKKYLRLWIVFALLIIWFIFIGNSNIISYDFWGTDSEEEYSFDNGKETDISENRQWHPREELFIESNTWNASVIDYSVFETPDWTAETHSDDIDPNFEEVFEDDTIKRLDIVIAEEDWQSMMDNMVSIYWEAGSNWQWNNSGGKPNRWLESDNPLPEDNSQMRPPLPNDGNTESRNPQDGMDNMASVHGDTGNNWQWNDNTGMPNRWLESDNLLPENDSQMKPPLPNDGNTESRNPNEKTNINSAINEENPIFVSAQVFYNGIEWYKVWVRFKWNSSLQSSWRAGVNKLSFKLDFDEYEDEYPWIKNQRFYWFKQLSLKNNYNDTSLIREKVASDIFLDAWLAGPHTALYTLYVDYGEGPIYFWLYTLVEEVEDTVIDTQFSDGNGNLYKPDGSAASFSEDSYNEEEYVKKTNQNEEDFSDVEKLLATLHDNTRITDPELWRENLDAIFDTDVFLKYLAVNTTIQNRDTYWRMTHNYFLYNNPDTGKLTWIPRDNNEALQKGKSWWSLELDFSNLDDSQRPLISYLYQDEVYKAKYDSYLQEVIDGPFNTDTMQWIYTSYADLVKPYAISEIDWYTFLRNDSDFDAAIEGLITYNKTQITAVNNYLSKN